MSISKEASEITKVFAELRNHGYIVVNHNTNTYIKSRTIQKLTDYIIIGRTGIHFIEVKLKSTKDTIKPHQEKIRETLIQLQLKDESKLIHYWICATLENAQFIYMEILNGVSRISTRG